MLHAKLMILIALNVTATQTIYVTNAAQAMCQPLKAVALFVKPVSKLPVFKIVVSAN